MPFCFLYNVVLENDSIQNSTGMREGSITGLRSKGQMSVSGEIMCTILINRLAD